MKRTRELTSIHYRREVKRAFACQGLRGHCPVCGSTLEASVVSQAAQPPTDRLAPVETAVFRLVSEGPKDELSGITGGHVKR
jgi:hypothetical protein